jgi:hypothetical protein
MEQKTEKKVFAISQSDFADYGCPHCGGIFGHCPVSGGGSATWICADCSATTVLLAPGRVRPNMTINGITPVLEEHPRQAAGKIDREALAKKRADNYVDSAIANYAKLLAWGFKKMNDMEIISYHTSKSVELPIVRTKKTDSNVDIVWFAHNFYNYFLGMRFKKAICTTLLYPISGGLGSVAGSSHENTSEARPITNFEKASSNNKFISNLGLTCSDYFVPSIIGYLDEVSKLDVEKIIELCYQGGRYDYIHGNHVDLKKLLSLSGLDFESKHYDATIKLPEESLFANMEIGLFDGELGGSSVRLTLKEGCFLPPMTFPERNIYANVSNTQLGDYIPAELQPKGFPNSYDKYVLSHAPIHLLKSNRTKINIGMPEPHFIHWCLKPGPVDLIFNAPNILDAVMTAVYLVKVVDPLARVYFHK